MSARGSAAGNHRGLPRKTWYFTFDLQASDAGVESQLEAFESSPFRRNSLKTASIISFSRSADGSPDIRGFISGKTMWQSTVQAWLTDPALSKLQLRPISDRFNDEFIVSFLADSELPGRRIRMDTMNPSGAPRVRGGGRPRTRPLVGCEVGATCAAATALHAGAGAVTAAGGVSDVGAAAGVASAALGAGARSPRCDVAAGAGTGAPAPTAVVRDRGVCPSPSDAGGGRRSGNPGQVATPTSLPRPPPPPPPPSPPAAADPVAAGGAACFGGGAGPDSSAAVPRPGDAGMPPAGMGVKGLTSGASPGTSSPWRSAAAAGGGATKLVLAAQVGARAGGSTPPSLAAGPGDAAGLPRQTPAGADLPCPYAQCASSTSWPAALDFSPIGFRYGTSTQYAQLQPVGSYMAHFPYGTPAPAQYFYPPWVPGIGHVRQSESSQAASNEVSSSCRQRKIRKLLTPADADVQTRLVEMEELCTKLTANLSKETKRAEQERARAEQERALRKEQTKRAGHEAKRADREAGRAKAAETKAEDRRKAADAWRKKAERARDKLADCRVGPP